jgi:hypothetical protein
MNKSHHCPLCILLSFALLSASAVHANELLSPKEETKGVRRFSLNYDVLIQGPEQGAAVRVWLPEAQTTDDQKVTVLNRNGPSPVMTGSDPTFRNRIAYFEAKMPESRNIRCQISYQIERFEVLGLPGERPRGPMTLTEAQRKLHLAPNKKIPLNGKSQQLVAGLDLPRDQLQLGRLFYNRVDDLVKYDKSRPGYGTGDSEWVCDSRFGNCTDFHSLFIGWSRAHQLPARFEIGFSLPAERGEGEIAGYHCWAFFYVDGHGWIPVDISEADKHPDMKEYYFGHLTTNRVTFTQGRDIQLVPSQSGEPLNFFIYPYVEVNGKELPKEQVKLTLSFKDE